MKITILTTFPEMFTPLHTSMLGRAEKAGILEIREVDIRAYSKQAPQYRRRALRRRRGHGDARPADCGCDSRRAGRQKGEAHLSLPRAAKR